jgi:uncharacterized membrane protein
MKQPTAPLYPELSTEDGQNYRLQKISEIEQTLIKERDTRQSLYKKYKRSINITDGVDTTLISGSVIMGGMGLAMPLMLPLEIAAIVCGVAGVCVKFIRRRLHAKAKKHDEIKMVAESKLNSVKDLISKALNDGQISEQEFKVVLDELDRYNDLKDKTQSRNAELSREEKQKLIEAGKAEALKVIQKKIKDT